MFKTEQECSDGDFLVFSCKQYMFSHKTNTKTAMAGITKSTPLDVQSFFDAIYKSQTRSVEQYRRTHITDSVVIQCINARLFNKPYVKGIIANDLVTVHNLDYTKPE